MLTEGCVSNQTSVVSIIVFEDHKMLAEGCVSYQTLGTSLLWSRARVTIDVVNVRKVNGRDHRLRPNFDRGVLPGQQVMVRCRNSFKIDDFLNSFFIHSTFV